MSRERTSTWVRLTATGAGRIGLAASAGGLVLTTLPGRAELGDEATGAHGDRALPRSRRPDRLTQRPGSATPPTDVKAILDAAERALVAYYAAWPEYPGRRIGDLWRGLLDLPVDLEGLTTFSRSVLELLRQVPPGEVVTYGQLAGRAGSPRAARAVGSVMAGNPLPIVLPCHRVVASDGSLGGFAGASEPEALELKTRLLRYEGWSSLRCSFDASPGTGPAPRIHYRSDLAH